MKKKPHLAVYDYGTGGIWVIMDARTGDEITKKYPELTVVGTRRAWMTDDQYGRVLENRSFDVDDEPSGWLLTLVEERRRNSASS